MVKMMMRMMMKMRTMTMAVEINLKSFEVSRPAGDCFTQP